MMGLEPTTFCMARNPRQATRRDTSRQLLASVSRTRGYDDLRRHEPTGKADSKADYAARRKAPSMLVGVPAA